MNEPVKIGALFNDIARIIPTLPGWCTVERACEYAEYIVALRPKCSMTLGVFGGRDVIAMALAHKAIGGGKVIAIDPWEAAASVDGEVPANVEWWGKKLDYEKLYRGFLGALETHEVRDQVMICRHRSDNVMLPDIGTAGVVSIDGNHAAQAVRDVGRFAPLVKTGGYLYMDDLNWEQGYVKKAAALLPEMGFVHDHNRDTGAWFIRS